jgi:hypothetical protein
MEQGTSLLQFHRDYFSVYCVSEAINRALDRIFGFLRNPVHEAIEDAVEYGHSMRLLTGI